MRPEIDGDNRSGIERRVRAALLTEAASINESDLRPQTSQSVAAAPVRRRTPLLAVAVLIVMLGGVVTVLSIVGRSNDHDVATSLQSGPAPVTVSALPQSSASCAFGGFVDYAQRAAEEGDAMVTGTVRSTGSSRQEVDGELGWQYSQVEITIDSVLAGQLAPETVTGWVPSGVDFLGSLPTPSSGQQHTGGSAPPAVLSYEGNGGWATDGKFLGVMHRRSDGTFLLNPTPMIGNSVVVGLGCWGSGGLPTTHQRVDLVLAGHPPAVISAPVDLVDVEEVRDLLRG